MPNATDIMNQVGGMTAITIGISVVVTLVILFIVFRFVGNIMGSINKAQQNTAQLLATGEPAQAKVLQLADTGMKINYDPVVQIVLEVTSPSRGTYQAQVQSLVPMIKLSQLQPGQTVQVKIDPMNPNNVAVDLR
jgi:hypothetical protein